MTFAEIKSHIEWLRNRIIEIEGKQGIVIGNFQDAKIEPLMFDLDITIHYNFKAEEGGEAYKTGLRCGASSRSTTINGITGRRSKVRRKK